MTISHVWVTDPPDRHARNHPAANHAVLAVLRSPLHHLLDMGLCELRYTAPQSRMTVSLPVMYATEGDDLVVLVGDPAEKQWWRSFRNPYAVQVRRGSVVRAGTGRVLVATDPRYPAAVDAYRRRHGLYPVNGDRIVLIEHLTAMENPSP
jgi:hypothetical protein